MRSSHCCSPEKNPTRIHEGVGLIPGLTPWIAMSCGVGPRCGSDLALPWLWSRLAAATLIPPLAWEILSATGVAPPQKKSLL